MNVIRFWNVSHETTHLIIDDSFPTDSIWFITSQIFVQRALQLITENQKTVFETSVQVQHPPQHWQPRIAFEMNVQL